MPEPALTQEDGFFRDAQRVMRGLDRPGETPDQEFIRDAQRVMDDIRRPRRQLPWMLPEHKADLGMSAFDHFSVGLKTGFLAPIEFTEFARRERVGLPDVEGFWGGLGLVVGGGLPTAAVAALSKSPAPFSAWGRVAQPVLVGMFSSSAAVRKMEETGNLQATLGAAAFEAAGEYVGLRYITEITGEAAKHMGRLILKREYSAASRLAGSFAGAAVVEGGEELFTLVGTELNDAFAGVKTYGQAVENIKRNAPMTFVMGASGGAFATLTAAGAVAALRAARGQGIPIDARHAEALDAIDRVLAAPEAPAVPVPVEAVPAAEVAVEAPLPEAKPVPTVPVAPPPAEVIEEPTRPAAPPAVPEIVREIAALDPQDKAEIRQEVAQVIKADDALPEQGRMDQEDRANAEFVLDQLRRPTKAPAKIQRLTGEGKRAFLRRIGVLVPKEIPTVTERQALRAGLTKARAAARQADIVARREMRVKMEGKLRDLRARMEAQIEAQKARVVEEKVKAKTQKALRNELIKIVREHVPKQEQGKLLQSIKTIKDLGGLAAGIDRALEVTAAFEHRQAVKGLRDTLKALDPRTIRLPGLRQIAQVAKDSLAIKALSPEARKELESRLAAANRGVEMPSGALKSLERLTMKPIADLTTQEIIEITDALEAVSEQATLARRLLEARQAMELEEAAQEVSQALTSEGSPLLKMRELPETRLGDRPGLLAMIRQLLVGRVENMILPHIFDWIAGKDENGLRKHLYRPLLDGMRTHLSGYYGIAKNLSAFVGGLGLDAVELARWSNFSAIGENVLRNLLIPGSGNTQADVVQTNLDSGRTIRWTRMEMVHLLAMMADPDAKDRIIFDKAPVWIKGTVQSPENYYEITAADLSRIRRQADPRQLALAAKLVEIYNSKEIRGKISEWSLAHEGRDITKDFGETYFRLRRAKAKDAPDPTITRENFNEESLSSLGFKKARVLGDQSPVVITDALAEANEYVWQALGLVNRGPVITTARSILRNPKVAGILERATIGRRLQKRMDDVFDAYVVEVIGQREPPHPLVSALVHNVQRAILAGNVKIMAYAPISILGLSRDIPGGYLRQAFVGGAMFDSSLDAKIFANPILRARYEGSSMGLVVEGGSAGGVAQDQDVLMAGYRIADHTTVRMAYAAATTWAREIGLTDAEAQAWAMEKAEQAVLSSQPTQDALHLSGIGLEARKHPLVRIFTMFRSQTSKILSTALTDYAMALRTGDPQHLKRAISTTVFVVGGQAVAYVVIRDLFARILRGFKPYKEEKEWTDTAEKYLRETLEAIGGLVVMGDFFANIVRIAFDERPRETGYSVVISELNDILRGFNTVQSHVRNSDFDADFWDGMAKITEGTTALFGLPTGFLINSGRQIWRAYNEKKPATEGFLLLGR